jgi:predicted nucleic acid-binding protein
LKKVFDHVAAHGVSLVSEQTIAELIDVLNREKFRKYIPLDQSPDYVEWYAGISEQVTVTQTVVACRDPKTINFCPRRSQERLTASLPAITTCWRW